jgi:formate dehydrogenase assembly factor FdhD
VSFVIGYLVSEFAKEYRDNKISQANQNADYEIALARRRAQLEIEAIDRERASSLASGFTRLASTQAFFPMIVFLAALAMVGIYVLA